MTRPIRWVLGVTLGLFLVGIVAAAAVFLGRDAIFRKVFISRVRAATGMEVKIDSVHVGLLSPTMTIDGLKLYNTAAFGGSLCLDMPKLQLEYDPAAVRAGMIHLPLVRLSLAQIELVTDKKGRSNFDGVEKHGGQLPSHTDLVTDKQAGSSLDGAEKHGGQPPSHTDLVTDKQGAEKQGGQLTSDTNSVNRFIFSGIDTLDLRLGKFHVSNLRSGTEMKIDFGMKDQVFHDVKSDTDLTGVAVLLALRGSSTPDDSGIDLNKLINALVLH